MKKLFLVPLMALLMCAHALAVEVQTFDDLKSALDAGGEITLTSNIESSEVLTISKATTIDGQGLYYIKGTAASVLNVTAQGKVVIKNVTIFAARAADGTGGIQLGASDIDLLVDNVKINSTCRGIHQTTVGLSGMNVVVQNSVLSLIWGGVYAADGTASVNYDLETKAAYGNYSRGLNIYAKNSNFTIENSTIQGFFYSVNVPGQPTDGMKVYVNNCSLKGRAAMNVWGTNGEYTYTDCSVIGINNFGGSSEGFACFVFNANGDVCSGNKLTINGGTVVSAVFNETGSTNPNANQYFVADRGKNNTVVINNASYSCTKDLGIQKGGVFETVGSGSTATINGGTYDCPEIIEGNGGGEVIINEGNFDVIVVTSTAYYPEGYEPYFDNVTSNITINGGTFENAADEDINALTFANNEEKDPVSLVGNAVETYDNQDGSVSVVPQGTETAKVDNKPYLVWGTDVDLTAQNVVVQEKQTLTLYSGTANPYRLDMGDSAIVIVKSGSTLNIGEGGVALNNKGDYAPKIIVEQGATLVLNGLMYGSVPENLIIKASADSYGQLLVNPNVQAHGDNHPNGTLEFVTKSFYKAADNYQYERFGIPTYTTLEAIDCAVDGLYTGIYVYENGWQDLGYLQKGTPFANISRLNKPFIACNLIAYQEAAGAAYTFKGALNGNSNASLTCDLEWNSFANSYTADVDVVTFMNGLGSGANVDATVYLATPTGMGTYSWDPVDAIWANGEKLAPMQAFILHNKAMTEVKTINYNSMVWTPGTAAAPARHIANNDLTAKLRIIVANEQGVLDNLKMSESYGDLHNAAKYMNEGVNIYAHIDDEKVAIAAAENLDETYIGFSAAKGGQYTISFANVEGREFDLVDLTTGARVEAIEGNTYTFSTADNTNNDYRFKLVERKKVMTGAEDIRAEKAAKGIYTIMGQYLGEMNIWSTLPAGVYVVDGEKRVK